LIAASIASVPVLTKTTRSHEAGATRTRRVGQPLPQVPVHQHLRRYEQKQID